MQRVEKFIFQTQMLLEPAFCMGHIQIHMQPDKALLEILGTQSLIELIGLNRLIRPSTIEPIRAHHAVDVRAVGEGLG